VSIDELRAELRKEQRRARIRRLLLILAAIVFGALIGGISTAWFVLHSSEPAQPLLIEEMNARPAAVIWRA
jgi:hypothetical protein